MTQRLKRRGGRGAEETSDVLCGGKLQPECAEMASTVPQMYY